MNFQDPSDFAVWGCPSNSFCLRNIQYIAQEEPGNTASYCGTVEGRNSHTKNISANVPDVWVAVITNTISPGIFPVPFCLKCIKRIPDDQNTGTKLDRALL